MYPRLAGALLGLALLALPCLADPPDLSPAKAQLEARDWKKARKTLKRAAGKIAKGPAQETERQAVAELALLRALAEVGAEDPRRADWYWWVSKMFADEAELVAMAEVFPEAWAELQAATRPVPERRPPDPNFDYSKLSGVRTEGGGRPMLEQRACRGFTGTLRFSVSTGEGMYYQAPRWREGGPQLDVRPMCVYAVLERNRDRKGRIPGGVNRINEKF